MGLLSTLPALRRPGRALGARLPGRGRCPAAPTRGRPGRRLGPVRRGPALQGGGRDPAGGPPGHRCLPAPTPRRRPRPLVRRYGESRLAGEAPLPRAEPGLRRDGRLGEGGEPLARGHGPSRADGPDRAGQLRRLHLSRRDRPAGRAVCLLPGAGSLRLAFVDLPGVLGLGGRGEHGSPRLPPPLSGIAGDVARLPGHPGPHLGTRHDRPADRGRPLQLPVHAGRGTPAGRRDRPADRPRPRATTVLPGDRRDRPGRP
jgi:hypothetical protein